MDCTTQVWLEVETDEGVALMWIVIPRLQEGFATTWARSIRGGDPIHHSQCWESKALELDSTPLNMTGYEALLDLVENIVAGSFDFYYGLFMLDLAFEALNKLLFGRLHDITRKQLFGNAERLQVLREDYALPKSLNTYLLQIFKLFDKDLKLKIAIIGFGNFGHTVLAYSRIDYSDVVEELGVSNFSNADDLCEEDLEVTLLCMSIQILFFVDVLSVKEFPRSLFLQNLPQGFGILFTHPMFGPKSGKNGWNDLTFVYDKVTVGNEDSRIFLGIFAREGYQMVEMTCAEHDRHTAGSQFITHTMGTILEKLGLESKPINIKGYETLLKLVENTIGDNFDLYYSLFMLDLAFESLKNQLFGRLCWKTRVLYTYFIYLLRVSSIVHKPSILNWYTNTFYSCSFSYRGAR
ncbi:hypothetical protein UlMin_014536 [Ulmus minor]